MLEDDCQSGIKILRRKIKKRSIDNKFITKPKKIIAIASLLPRPRELSRVCHTISKLYEFRAWNYPLGNNNDKNGLLLRHISKPTNCYP